MANGVSLFERALDRSTPGFDSLLNVIQTETNRIERNRAMARQLEMKEDMIDLQAEKEIDVYNETTAIQREKDRQLQRDLAETEDEAAQEKTEAAIAEEMREKGNEMREDYEKYYVNNYGEVKSKHALAAMPNMDVRVGYEDDEAQAYYKVGDKLYTKAQFDDTFGWYREAASFIQKYQEYTEDDRLAQNSTSKEVGFEELTDARGVKVQEGVLGIGDGQGSIKKKITKKYLGAEEAAEVITKIRNGDREAYRKFVTGQYDFNNLPKGENDTRRSIQTNMTNLLDTLNADADWNWSWDWVAEAFTFGWAGDGAVGKDFTVAEIGREIGEIGSQEDVLRWKNIIQNYGKLKKGKKVPFSQLYVNPKLLMGEGTEVPVENYFLTEEEIKNSEAGMQKIDSDFELTNKNIINAKSKGLLKSALKDTAKDSTK